MPATPTQLTLRECRRRLWPAAVVEKWNPFARIRQDLFGGIDIVALGDQQGALGIQATSDSNVAARVAKLRALVDTPGSGLREWVEHENELQVWGWKKVKNRWHVRRIQLDLHSTRTL